MNDTNRKLALLASGYIIALLILLALAFSSCRTQKQVSTDTATAVDKTASRVDVQKKYAEVLHDSVIINNFIIAKGDTVYMYRDRVRTSVNVRTDTVTDVRVDTVYRDRVRTVTRETTKPPDFWHSAATRIILLIVIASILIFVIKRLRHRVF